MSLFGIAALIVPMAAFADEEILWKKSDIGIDENKVTAVSAMQDVPNVLYAGTSSAIYKSVDSGKNWIRVFMLKGQERRINNITYDPRDREKVFAATSDGLYISKDGGENWKRCFRGSDELQREVTEILIDENNPEVVYIGTRRGLFVNKDRGKKWQADGAFTNKEILSLAMNDKDIYACAVDGVYCNRKESGIWDRIYIVKAYEVEDSNGDSDNGDTDEEERVRKLSRLAAYNDKVYLATDKGVLVLKAGQERWSMMTEEGLLTKDIKSVLPVAGALFVATDKGIFSYSSENNRWNSVSAGLTTLKVNEIVLSERGKLFAATEKGLYISRKVGTVPTFKNSTKAFTNEPTIAEIQQVAIKYAEVSPDKIKWMRQAAMNKAWLPDVNFGLDGDINRTIDLDRGGTNDPDFYIEGPKDKDWGWNIDFEWDLSELIWNASQTSIDVRSRLIVQLRNDVLDEVTKLYFERQRLKIELFANPPKDQKQKILKELRLAELTANIDALTGGYLSANLNKK